jgi:glycosyltransferase involved in cell wall biosynthesis
LINNQQISLIIPAYNEAKSIDIAIEVIRDYEKQHGKFAEIIVVNDGSTDDTLIRAQAHEGVQIIDKKQNQGKGKAVQDGMLKSTSDWALFLDADLSIPIQELLKFIPHTEAYDLVIASRNLPESKRDTKQAFYRTAMGKSFAFLVQSMFKTPIRDTQCGFKLIKRAVINQVFPKMSVWGWCFDVEMLILAESFAFKVKEVPITIIDRTRASKVRPIRTSLEMFKDLLRIRRKFKRKEYN